MRIDPAPLLQKAIEIVRTGDVTEFASLNDAPFALYVTDAEGVITYFNKACISFAGRTPKIGEDRWCVTWKLFTQQGELLPHDQCPMAVAIKERRKVRGAGAVAEQPNGRRVAFMPYPTPVIGDDGHLVGAVNLLVDASLVEDARSLRNEAQRCRRLAQSVDALTAARLEAFAAELDERAAKATQLH